MHCAICQNTSFTTNDKNRPFKVCTRCGAMERHRALWNILAQKLLSPESKVLEIAPLSKFIFGEFLQQIYPGITYKSTDKYKNGNPNDPRAVPPCNTYCDLTQLDLNFENNYYDVVLMQHVLEEIEEYHKALYNIFNVVKPDGLAILEIPCESKGTTHIHHNANKYGNVWKFKKDLLVAELRGMFCDVKVIEYNEGNHKGSFFICRKKK